MHEATLEKEGFLEKLILYSGDWELVVIIDCQSVEKRLNRYI